ncbi:UDP-4-amino-4,6-dideoxy-N-acetyl-beta-L-altrosamine transaminase [bacterium SCSIO 12696]|uniref:UDP-4-amino-4, 6-dideoxy-N-acetyl-beta-L-altrosamine transaminase n=1 Tax=Porticoccus sp. W117 TaxID=3054777 RepID=UPI0022058059|nr:UDP-4-amino-4,6-dideoxy-N-acetyl-beta-L-altrosamine transaminase [Porticoccus sp. W117]MDM3872388.1 UDP-4-amino-4,6-dideoxy-N-acetyl-beta-L-altrosamine transaminase [Porticoccus sp. W117]UTW46033.1 UDP-4-amino-4,6-dideoxy-N-acetyl-beta-L-altrosamine transaminase [bacterium SCSIO 12696]
MIPYGRQDISKDDIDAVVSVLQSDFLTQGPKVPEFEGVVCTYTGAKHALATNSATSALHIACLALDVGPGDVVWTSPVTFVASANCARYCGADVDFVDIDPKTYNLSISSLRAKLEQVAIDGGRLPKVVIPVHLCGQPCDMAGLKQLADQYGFLIIEDASHAIGGRYKDSVVGSCEFSDVTVFSFHPVKIVTTAEGGMAVTNDENVAKRMSLYRSHGVTRDADLMTHEPDGDWYYQQVALGFNYRMTELQAALGISQMARLDDFVSARHELAARYDKLLSALPVITPHQESFSYSGFHLYVIQVETEGSGPSHKEIFDSLRSQGVGVNLHYIPVHTQPYYRDLGFARGHYPVAEEYYSKAISLPLFHQMTYDQQDEVVAALKVALKGVG